MAEDMGGQILEGKVPADGFSISVSRFSSPDVPEILNQSPFIRAKLVVHWPEGRRALTFDGDNARQNEITEPPYVVNGIMICPVLLPSDGRWRVIGVVEMNFTETFIFGRPDEKNSLMLETRWIGKGNRKVFFEYVELNDGKAKVTATIYRVPNNKVLGLLDGVRSDDEKKLNILRQRIVAWRSKQAGVAKTQGVVPAAISRPI